MEKRLKVSGYISLPEGLAIPPMGSTVYGSFVAEVDGDHKDRHKRKGGVMKITQTAPATMTNESTLDRIVPPGDPNQPELGDEDETPKRKPRKRPPSVPETPEPVAESELEPAGVGGEDDA
jgi:hypothetical protein